LELWIERLGIMHKAISEQVTMDHRDADPIVFHLLRSNGWGTKNFSSNFGERSVSSVHTLFYAPEHIRNLSINAKARYRAVILWKPSKTPGVSEFVFDIASEEDYKSATENEMHSLLTNFFGRLRDAAEQLAVSRKTGEYPEPSQDCKTPFVFDSNHSTNYDQALKVSLGMFE
jgi:hypothetical protein